MIQPPEALQALDRILRGQTTQPSVLHPKRFDVPLPGLAVVLTLLAALYGGCMGFFALFNHPTDGWWLLLGSAAKVPALFALTLLVTFPSLYVFNALVGSRLGVVPLLRLLTACTAVTVAVLASLGPIVAFFSVSTTSHRFAVLLNVFVFAVAGILGLKFLHQTLHRLAASTGTQDALDFGPVEEDAGPLDPVAGEHVLNGHVQVVFRCWMLVFGVVGAQMGWVLRPFIGSPDAPASFLRARESNFFESVWRLLLGLVS